MAKERKASVIYEGNGTQQTFSFPFDYLRKAFVKAEIVEGSGITELEQGKDYSITDKELTLASSVSVATGKLLKIYRETTTDPLVEWQDASVLRSADLSLQEVQLLHLAEETADKVFDSGMSTAPTNTNVWDGQYKRITNLLDPQEDGDAVTLRYVNDKQHGLITALKNEGATQDAGLKSTGDSQNTRLTNTGNTQNTRLTTTGDTQNKRLTDTGDSYVATMTTLKDTATTQASNASQSASSASASASTATTQATNAGKMASNASASASTASTKATEVSNSANLSKAWAMSDSSPDGVSGNKSSKTWANEAKASASNASASASTATAKATEATTQATNAANSASAAAKSATEAAKFDPSSYYTKAQTYTKTEVDTHLSNYYQKTQTYTKTEVDKVVADKIATAVMPTGTVLPFAGNTVPNNYLLCNGRAVSRSTYANLFAVIGTTYGAGDGSSTFNLPNLVDKFIEGGTSSGAVKSAGLPNIRGSGYFAYGDSDYHTIVNKYNRDTNIISKWNDGAIQGEPTNHYQDGGDGGDGELIGTSHVTFDASRCSSIYGASSTVQPPAIVMKYIIKI